MRGEFVHPECWLNESLLGLRFVGRIWLGVGDRSGGIDWIGLDWRMNEWMNE